MADLPDLLPLAEAQRRVLDGVSALPTEVVGIAEAGGRVLAEPAQSALTLPVWINSAMDGFAVRAAEVASATRAQPVVLRYWARCPPVGRRTWLWSPERRSAS